MEPILDKARAGQNLLERLVGYIPGFKGYQDRDLRREADGAQRDHLAHQLEENKTALNDIAQRATRAGVLDLMNDIETARKRLDKLVARIRYADRGYAGFFDAIKVDETMLGRVYQFDLDLLQNVTEIEAAAQKAKAASASEVKPGLDALVALIDATDARLSEREQILSGIK
jgi:hypothetical protein